MRGENPYDMRLVDAQVHTAGDDPARFPNTDPPPSVYLPTTFPVVAPFAGLPWRAARLAWCLLSVAVFLFSVALLMSSCGAAGSAKWLLMAGALLFSPASSGLSTGNPSVISCGLTLCAIFLAFRGRTIPSIVLLGLAHSVKPQVSIAAAAVLLVWGYWRTVLGSLLIPAAAAVISFVPAGGLNRYGIWLHSLTDGIRAISLPGGVNDPSPANYFSYHLVNAAAVLSIWMHDPRAVSALVWVGTIALIALYCWRREKQITWRDAAFFCVVFLIPVYHRYYDCQLLLGVVPWLCSREARGNWTSVAIWGGLSVLLFPLQAMLAEAMHGLNPASVVGFILLRHQPMIVLLLAILLTPWRRVARPVGEWTFAGD